MAGFNKVAVITLMNAKIVVVAAGFGTLTVEEIWRWLIEHNLLYMFTFRWIFQDSIHRDSVTETSKQSLLKVFQKYNA